MTKAEEKKKNKGAEAQEPERLHPEDEEKRSDSRPNSELAAILFGAGGLLLAFFLWAPGGLSGALGAAVRSLSMGLFGSLALLLPLLFFYLATELFLEKAEQLSMGRRLCVFLLFITIVSLIAAFSLDPEKIYLAASTEDKVLASRALELFYRGGSQPELISHGPFWNGGLVGSLAALSLIRLSGYAGSLIILITQVLALSALAFDLSWKEFLKRTAVAVNSGARKVGEESRKYFIYRSRQRRENMLQQQDDEKLRAQEDLPEEEIPEENPLPNFDWTKPRDHRPAYSAELHFPNAQASLGADPIFCADDGLGPDLPPMAEDGGFGLSAARVQTKGEGEARQDFPSVNSLICQAEIPETSEPVAYGLPHGDWRGKPQLESGEEGYSRDVHFTRTDHPMNAPVEGSGAADRNNMNLSAQREQGTESISQEGHATISGPIAELAVRPVYIPVKEAYLVDTAEHSRSIHETVQKSQGSLSQSLSAAASGGEEKSRSQVTDESRELDQIAQDIKEDQASLQKESARDLWKDRSEDKTQKHRHAGEQLSLFAHYEKPPTSLLNEDKGQERSPEDKEEIRLLGAKLEKTLRDFGVDARVINFITGPTISRFELSPGPGVKVSKIVNLADDIALALAATGVRIEAPIPGKSAIGIEIPNKKTSPVLLRGLVESKAFRNEKAPLCAALGRDIQGSEILCDLSKMPHLLIAGATGSGKSVCINSILISLLFRSSPEDLKLLMIDPKVVELSVYNGIPHLLAPVVTDPKKAYGVLEYAVNEMTHRYSLFAENSVRDFRAYNELVRYGQIEGGEHLPLILVVIDELSDLMATTPTEVENAISRLTAMARAAGIHLIIATQRPSVDVITGVIKANIPSRIAFAVASQVDSRTIIDMGGAEKLLGKGDMLYYPQSASKPLRGQGSFVSDAEVERVIAWLKNRYTTNYDEKVQRALELSEGADGKKAKNSGDSEEDELLMDALQTCIETGYASVSLLQRRLTIGYPRAARLIDALHENGWVGPFEGSKPRKVLMTAEEFEALKDNS